jgi:hypothetical protein
MQDQDRWQESAACRDMPTSVFFPATWAMEPYAHRWTGDPPTGPPAAFYSARAAAACERCDVREPCLAEALRWTVGGIWAGTTPAERAWMRRRLGIKGRSIAPDRNLVVDL